MGYRSVAEEELRTCGEEREQLSPKAMIITQVDKIILAAIFIRYFLNSTPIPPGRRPANQHLLCSGYSDWLSNEHMTLCNQ